jgi:hypothetical protein
MREIHQIYQKSRKHKQTPKKRNSIRVAGGAKLQEDPKAHPKQKAPTHIWRPLPGFEPTAVIFIVRAF